MFTVKFDFNYEEYKKNIGKYKQTKPYDFDSVGRARIEQACVLMNRLARLVIWKGKLRDRLLKEYFNSDHNDPFVPDWLTRLSDIIGDPGVAVTFVDGSKKHLTVEYTATNIDIKPRWLPKPSSSAEMATAGAWVHPLPGSGTARAPGEHHVGSGVRINFGPAVHPSIDDLYDLAGTIYHELTHKFLGTSDHAYDPDPCRALAKIDRNRAIKNADSYCCFLVEFGRNYDVGKKN